MIFLSGAISPQVELKCLSSGPLFVYILYFTNECISSIITHQHRWVKLEANGTCNHTHLCLHKGALSPE